MTYGTPKLPNTMDLFKLLSSKFHPNASHLCDLIQDSSDTALHRLWSLLSVAMVPSPSHSFHLVLASWVSHSRVTCRTHSTWPPPIRVASEAWCRVPDPSREYSGLTSLGFSLETRYGKTVLLFIES